MIKKRIVFLLTYLLITTTLLTACGENNTEEKVLVGLGTHIQLNDSTIDANPDANDEKDQLGKTDVNLHVAAVTTNSEGKIVSAKVDAIEISATFKPNGEVVTGTDQTFKSKKELGYDYNMKKYGPQPPNSIGKEWFEQVDAFEKYIIGMNVEQVESLLGTNGYTSDETLKIGCTIRINGLVNSVVRAMKNADENKIEVSSTDKLSLGLIGELSKAQFDASAEDPLKAGQSTATANFVAITSTDEKITACVLDSLDATITWDNTGKITSDLEKEPATKYELKENYNMKPVSATKGNITGGAEWYEQANAFMKYIEGKNANQVAAISVDSAGYTTDEVLKTGCTISISDFQKVVIKALSQ